MNNIHKQGDPGFYIQLGLIETYLMVFSMEFNDLLNDEVDHEWLKYEAKWYELLKDSLRKTNE